MLAGAVLLSKTRGHLRRRQRQRRLDYVENIVEYRRQRRGQSWGPAFGEPDTPRDKTASSVCRPPLSLTLVLSRSSAGRG
jgi:hypothetical protein